MNARELTAPCGLDCFNCPLYLARTNDTLRQTLAERLGLPPERTECSGCRAQSGTIAFLGMSQPCKVWRCTAARGLHNCSECDDFPCDHLHPYADRAASVPHNTKVFNLALIRKLGLDAWAASKAAEVKRTYYKGTLEL